jgi:Tfp pilus assembly protein PilX
MPFLIANWRTLAVLALVAVLGAYGLTMRLQRDAARTELATFKEQVAEAAQRQTEQALKRTIADEKRKEEADAAHAQTVSALNARIAGLRARHPDSGFVPPAPATTSRPDLACFDRAEYQRADGAFTAEARGLADEGATAAIDLDAAKVWAQGR